MSNSDSRLSQGIQVVSAAIRSAHSLKEGGSGVEHTLLAGGQPLPKVRYEFSSSADLGVAWHVQRLHVREGLSELYQATVDLVLEYPLAEVDVLLGSSCELLFDRAGLMRRLLGLVHQVEDLGILTDKRVVRVHLTPALWHLSQRVDSYIFQERTVPQILEDVLNEGLAPLRRKVRLALQREYPIREYCVQYNESDLDFTLRLMKEEGIAFYFEHGGEAEELVLVDSEAALRPCETMDEGPIWVSNEAGELAGVETVRSMEWRTVLSPTSVVLRDFDWTRPGIYLDKQVRSKEAGAREEFLYPAELTITAYEGGRYTKDDASARARLMREGQQVGAKRGLGTGNVTGFQPGRTFMLEGHIRADLEQKYLLTRVEHFGEEPGQQYQNRFECIPFSVPYRPEYPLARRRIPGLQTATVVGPPGEEIYTDRHGRIKVQFHWDRVGQRNERASCWVRVAQAWAGTGFGTLFIPRVGMEVVVHFLEGNPDRPLVLGCVYNGANPTPTLLPEERTCSTLRTDSTPGGNGYNELRFEDSSGQEQIFLRAQRDLVEVIQHDHSTRAGNDQSNTVQANQSESIGGNQSLTVSGQRTKTVKKDEVVTVEQNRTETVSGNETLSVQGQRSLSIGGTESYQVEGDRQRSVKGKETVTLQADRETTVTGSDSLSVSQQRLVSADQKYQLTQGGTTLTFEGGRVELDAAGSIRLMHGSGEVEIESNGKVRVSSGTEIELACGGCLIRLQGSKLELSGLAEISLVGGSSSLKLDVAGVELSGPKVTSAAQTVNELIGTTVKLN